MSTMTEAPFSLTIKTAAGDLLTGRAATASEMLQRIAELAQIRSAVDGTPAVDPVAVVQQQLGGTVVAEIPAAPAPAYVAPVAAPAPQAGGPEVVSDRFGNQYTYGLAEAPTLPDGRGFYVKKAWTSRAGKRLTAWVDPAKGPKPFAPGAVEAELIWI